LILADQAEKAVALMRQEVGELLAAKNPREKSAEIAKFLTSGAWTHDYPITYERGAKTILMSHFGRPKGKPVEKYSLRTIGDYLCTLTFPEVSAVHEVRD